MDAAQAIVDQILSDLAPYPDLYHAGYTQDAMKEFAEANIVYALVGGEPLPTPHDLRVEGAAYLNGLAETVGELRRRCLDIIRHDHSEEAERLMEAMEIDGIVSPTDKFGIRTMMPTKTEREHTPPELASWPVVYRPVQRNEV